jgi:hypothetical protein
VAYDCTSNALASAAKCFFGMPPIQQKSTQVALLCAILNGTIVDCTASNLAGLAKCYTGFSPIQLDAIIVTLLCQIASGGGTGGGAPDYISYAGPPILNPPSLQNIVVDSNYQQWQYGPNGWQ